jgi:hypothetical protein
MGRIEELATAVLERNDLLARSLVQDIHREGIDLARYPHPVGAKLPLLTMSAALLELLAERQGVPAPAWTQTAGTFPEPFYTLKSALTMPRLRARCEAESPAPLKRRNVYSLGQFLTFA